MLRGDDVENIYLIENHHEALGYWRNMHIFNKTIIHIDSHHDLFEGTSFPWINNYLWFAIKENILKEIYLVYPKHIIKNFDLVEKYVASIMGFVLGKSRNLTIAIYIDRKTGGKIYDYMLL